MKFSRYLKNFYNNTARAKYSIFLLLTLMMLITIFQGIIMYKNDAISTQYSIFDILAHPSGKMGLVGYLPLSAIIMPIFSFIVIKVINNESSIYILVRNESRIGIWNKMAAHVIILALIFTMILVIGGYFISGFIVSSLDNDWKSSGSYIYSLVGNKCDWTKVSKIFTTEKMLSIIFLSVFLGVCACGFFIMLMKLAIKKSIYIYLILLIIFFIDAIAEKFSLILKQMTVNVSNWINPSSIIFNQIYLISLIILFYILGNQFITRCDFISNKH